MSDCSGLSGEGKFGGMVEINEGEVRRHVEEVVRGSVKEVLNGMLDAEAVWRAGR